MTLFKECMPVKEYILISGISGAMGSVAKEYFHQAGYGIIGVGRSKPSEEDLLNIYSENYYHLTSFDDKQVNELYSSLIDKKYNIKAAILLNGGFLMDQIHDFKIDQFEKMLEQNFTSTVFLTKYLLKYFEAQQNGVFFFMSAKSTNDSKNFAHNFSYTASKSLVNHLAYSIKNEYIRVALIKPSIIDTPINRKQMPNADFSTWIKPIDICRSMERFMRENKNNFSELVF